MPYLRIDYISKKLKSQFDYKVPWQAWLNWSDLPKKIY